MQAAATSVASSKAEEYPSCEKRAATEVPHKETNERVHRGRTIVLVDPSTKERRASHVLRRPLPRKQKEGDSRTTGCLHKRHASTRPHGLGDLARVCGKAAWSTP